MVIQFSLEEVLLWTSILSRSENLVKKKLNDRVFNAAFHKMLTDGLELCGLLVDYCDVLISCLDSHDDGTHSL